MAKDGRGASPVTLVEKRNFTHARCECGWSGPGRRSRKKARADAEAHEATSCPASKKK
jgi:hypothetical protein